MLKRRAAELAGWGGPPVPATERLGEDLAALTRGAPLTRGWGRSYGDASLPPADRPWAAASRWADRLLALDESRGILRAESGCCLRQLNDLLWPRGWALPVSPGTEWVSLGGMVAADVHGKNHHVAGTFGRHVRSLRMRLADDSVAEVNRQELPDLFRATLGGMGLTGHILEVECDLERIPGAWLELESRRYPTTGELAEALSQASRAWPMTAAWVDATDAEGRGVLLAGRWAEGRRRPRRRRAPLPVPLPAPSSLLNPLSLRIFNTMHWLGSRNGRRHGAPDGFFYPLDRVGHWNRLYGRRGLTQWQALLPAVHGSAAVVECLALARRLGALSYLAVLKDFGDEGEGLLSFPGPGFTLALDFPVGPGIAERIDHLNAWLVERGGRIYLAKDAYTRRERFAAMEGAALDRFLEVRERYDPQRRLRSRLSVRLFGDPEG